MRNLLILLFLFLSLYSNGKSSPNELKEAILSEIRSDLRNSPNDDVWYICNKDSSFFHSDTIKVYSHVNYIYTPPNCCDFIEWNFFSKRGFRLSKLKICQEPPVGIFIFNSEFNVKWVIDGENLTMKIINYENGMAQNFKVIGFKDELLWNNSNISKVLILVKD